MEINEYQERAMGTCLESSRNWCYMSDGLVEEVGELKGVVAKAVRHGEASVDGNSLVAVEAVRERMRKELGDVIWMVAGVASVMGWSLEEVAEGNLAKLAARKAAGTIDGRGDGEKVGEGRERYA